MYDIKYQHFINILNTYDNYGFISLSSYDKYHMMFIIVSLLSCEFNISLGNLLQHLNMSRFIKKYRVLGLDDNGIFIVPSLFNISMKCIKDNRIYLNNNFYNKLILST